MRHARNMVAAAVVAACSVPLAALAQADSTVPTGAAGTASAPQQARDTAERQVLGQQQARQGLVPGTTQGYVGANIGWTRWGSPPVVSGFPADRRTTGGKIYAGGLFTPHVGAELGYVHFGSLDRAGGRARAHGVNLSLVGSLPVDPVDFFAKIGTTYGFTRTSAVPQAGIATGSEDGFGLSYGAGLGFALTPTWRLVAEWERHRLRFAQGRESINMISVGARMAF